MPVIDVAQLKENIRQSFRKACLRRLDGREGEAVEILQDELPPLVKEWQAAGNPKAGEIEALFAEELTRTESAYWLITQLESRLKPALEGVLTNSQAEAMQSVAHAQLQLGINTIKDRLQAAMGELITYQGAEALGSRVSQELSERVRRTVNEVLEGYRTTLRALPTKEEVATQIDSIRVSFAAPLEKIANGKLDELINKSLDGILKKTDLDAALWQVQSTVVDKLRTLVSAESFESRMMASVTMLHDAQSKALQEAVTLLQAIIDKRLTDATGPIYQRVSSLVTFTDWERVQREANEKLVAELNETLGKRQTELAATVNERTETTLQRIKEVYGFVEQKLSVTQASVSDSLKIFSEKLAVLHIETGEQQRLMLKAMQKELAEQQTQSLTQLSTQQQNFLGGLQRDWELLNKNIEELKTRQNALAADLRAMVIAVDSVREEQVKNREALSNVLNAVTEQLRAVNETSVQLKQSIPLALQNFDKQIDTRLRERAQFEQAELAALQRKLEVGLTDTFSKKLKSLRVVTE